jgi:hypothetical protein
VSPEFNRIEIRFDNVTRRWPPRKPVLATPGRACQGGADLPKIEIKFEIGARMSQ